MDRFQKQRQRYNLINGLWEQDVISYYRSSNGIQSAERRDAMGKPQTSNNPFKHVVTQLSTLYQAKPYISYELSPEDEAELNSWNLFFAHQSVQLETNAVGESFIQIIETKDGGTTYKPVPAFSINKYKTEIGSNIDIVYLEKIINIIDSDGTSINAYEIYDIYSEVPFRVVKRDEKGNAEDITKDIYPEYDGNYIYKDMEGRPFIPFVVYHKKAHSSLWNENENHELVDLTYSTSIEWTMQSHATKNASWTQKVIVDAEIESGTTVYGSEAKRTRIPADPASVISLKSNGDRQATYGSFPLAMDPTVISDAIIAKTRQVYANLNIDSLQFTIQEAQSGVAIQLKKDSLDLWRLQQSEVFSSSDIDFIYKSILIRRLFGTTNIIPIKSVIGISYERLMISSADRTARYAELKDMLSLGLISKVDMFMELNNVSREEAIVELERIKADSML